MFCPVNAAELTWILFAEVKLTANSNAKIAEAKMFLEIIVIFFSKIARGCNAEQRETRQVITGKFPDFARPGFVIWFFEENMQENDGGKSGRVLENRALEK